MSSPLSELDPDELEHRLSELRGRLRPLEEALAELRSERDVLLTEVRRRQRAQRLATRSRLRAATREGELTSLLELMADAQGGALDDFAYSLKTGGDVRLGFAGARSQSVTWTDGRQSARADDLIRCSELFQLGWELGSPGRMGVRIHFAGSKQERLVDPADVFARPRAGAVPAPDSGTQDGLG